jgi:hypothetical protein
MSYYCLNRFLCPTSGYFFCLFCNSNSSNFTRELEDNFVRCVQQVRHGPRFHLKASADVGSTTVLQSPLIENLKIKEAAIWISFSPLTAYQRNTTGP